MAGDLAFSAWFSGLDLTTETGLSAAQTLLSTKFIDPGGMYANLPLLPPGGSPERAAVEYAMSVNEFNSVIPEWGGWLLSPGIELTGWVFDQFIE